jgi:membrane-bound lytic murein transglycosylase MltF
MHRVAKTLLLLLAVVACSCSPKKEAAKPAPVAANQAASADGDNLPVSVQSALSPELRPLVDQTFTGDLDKLVQRRIIRAGVPFNRTFYFIDDGVPRGLSYEYLKLFEDQLNKDLNTGNLKVHVILLPMPRGMLLQQLRAGRLDVVVAQLTVTPARQKLVDFSNPTRTNVNEVLVTGPGAPGVTRLEDLRGKTVFVRKSSSYYESIQAYNQRMKAQGGAQIDVKAAPENLEDDDLLEMVNAGLIPATVVDNYLANFWKQVFSGLVVHEDLTFRTGGNLAVAFRKDSPQLAAEINRFIAQNGLNTAMGAILNKRYLQNTTYVKDATSEEERKKFLNMVGIFKTYGQQYDFDYLLMAAQGYQESRLDQDAKSHVGAVGIMQLMPQTGAAQNVGDIHQIDPNIHAGVKYMRFMRDRYFKDDQMTDLNKALFTFAAYNAGAARIAALRTEAAQRGLDPNVWFGNVERIASERIGRETVTYVSNIYKYYVAYKLITEVNDHRTAAKSELEQQAKQ